MKIDKNYALPHVRTLLFLLISACSASACSTPPTGEEIRGVKTHSSSWHFSPTVTGQASDLIIAVPYASGDVTGELTDKVIYELKNLPSLQISDSSSKVIKITILDDSEEKIGYRYDPLDRNKKIIPNENRSKMLVSVSLIDSGTNRTLAGPSYILGSIDYDHQNSSIDNNILAYSMGQLADIDTAQDVTYIPLYRDIGKKIAAWLQNIRDIDDTAQQDLNSEKIEN